MADQKSFAETLYGWLERAEVLFLLLFLAGFSWRSSDASASDSLIIVSLGGLAGVFFLMAYRPSAVASADPKRMDFMTLLIWTILPKVTWISCAVCTISILLYFIKTGNKGYEQGLMIHTTITVIGLLMLGFAGFRGVKNARALLPMYYRAIPLLFAALYLLGYV